MIVTLAVIAVFIGYRAINRDDLDVEPPAIDYETSVRIAQRSGDEVLYPRTLPDGWRVTSLDYGEGKKLEWGLGVLTDDDTFVGIRQEDRSAQALVGTYVDDEIRREGQQEDFGNLAGTWNVVSDQGGDLGYYREAAPSVLVYGSAGPKVLEKFAELLTTQELPQN